MGRDGERGCCAMSGVERMSCAVGWCLGFGCGVCWAVVVRYVQSRLIILCNSKRIYNDSRLFYSTISTLKTNLES